MSKLGGPLAAFLVIGLAPMAMAQGQADDAPERFIVLFDALPPGLQANEHYGGAKVLAVDGTLGFAVVQASHGRAFREEAAKRPEVRGVEVDAVAEALGFTPNDPKFGSQYAPKLIGAPAAWATTRGASSASLCMLDTGVRTSHQDLAANYRGGIDIVNGDDDPSDDGGHGTRTAGVAAATINNGVGIAGVANVPFKEAKVLNSVGSGYNSGIASGIRWCADNGARVVSMSFGSSTANTAVRDAVDYAWGKGLLLVAGSGNGGCPDCVLYPAAFPNVIAVGSLDANRALSSTTSRGPQLDLAAPGVNVLTTGHASDSEYRTGGGTSIAAPHVAGAAALVWSAHPTWTNQQVRTALLATAQDVGAAGWDPGAGNGLVRPDLAIAYGSTPGTTSTTSTSAATTTTGAYQATVSPSSSSNEWWVQVGVSPAPAKVEVKVGSGAFVALNKESYGYSKSVHATKGTMVQFRVTSTGGQTATTPAQAWLVDMAPKTATSSASSTTTTAATNSTAPASTTTTSTAPPPAFTATFTPKSVGNDWWVETAVSASQGVAKVEAKVNNGAYVTLPKQDWGTYAKSINAPNGSQVTFRATNASGATTTSAAVTWT